MQQSESPVLGQRNVEVRIPPFYRPFLDNFTRVNAKLGGVNNILENSPLNDPNNPTIIMGTATNVFRDPCLILS